MAAYTEIHPPDQVAYSIDLGYANYTAATHAPAAPAQPPQIKGASRPRPPRGHDSQHGFLSTLQCLNSVPSIMLLPPLLIFPQPLALLPLLPQFMARQRNLILRYSLLSPPFTSSSNHTLALAYTTTCSTILAVAIASSTSDGGPCRDSPVTSITPPSPSLPPPPPSPVRFAQHCILRD